MKPKSTIATAVALLLAAALSLAAQESPKTVPAPPAPKVQGVADGSYKIQFNRPRSRGDKYALSIEAKYRQDTPEGINEGVVIFEGNASVMDVNAIGEPTMSMIHVTKAQEVENGKTINYKIEGADLGISFSKERFVMTARDGRKIPEEEQFALSQLVFHPPSGENVDEYLLPGREVKVGEIWKIDTVALAKSKNAHLADKSKGLDPKTVSGTVELVGIEEWEGTPCQHLRIEVTINSPMIPKFVGESFMQIKEELWLPVDVSVKKFKSVRVLLNRQKGKIYGDDMEMHDLKGSSEITTKTSVR